MMLHEVANGFLDLSALHIQFGQRGGGNLLRRADVRCFARVELCVHQEAMLQVVNAQRSSLAEADGAEMPGNFNSALVSRVNRRGKFRPRDVHVSLEGRRALIRPEINGLARVVRAGELVHLRCVSARALEIRPGDVHLRAGLLSGVNRFFQTQISVGFNASCGAN